MIEIVKGPPWPDGPMVLDLDDLAGLSLCDLAGLERREGLSVGAIRGRCEGAALAAALAVDLLYSAPEAQFGGPGDWSDIVIRRGVGIAGRKVMAYLTMTGRRIGAELAKKWGIIWEIHQDPVAAAVRAVERMCERSPTALATILRQGHRGAAADYILSRLTGESVR